MMVDLTLDQILALTGATSLRVRQFPDNCTVDLWDAHVILCNSISAVMRAARAPHKSV